MVRAVNELGEVLRQVLVRDLNVRAPHRYLKQAPEALNRVGVERLTRPIIVVGPFLRAVLDGAMNEAITGQ